MRALLAPGLLVVVLAIFLSPGLAGAVWLHQRRGLKTLYVLPVAALGGCLIGYLAFWIFLANPQIGRGFGIVVVLMALAALGWLAARRDRWLVVGRVDILAPLAFLYVVTLFYTGTLFGCAGTVPCLVDGYPMDNVLPQMFAGNVAAGHPRQLMGDWQSSDRPPLQAGIVLAQWFLALNPTGSHNPGYQLLGSMLQGLWIFAMWAATRRFGLSPGRTAAALGFCVFSGFFFFNSIFVWPKLLSGALALSGFLLLFAEPRRRLYWTLAAAMFGCALLSHTGVVFTMIPMAAVLLWSRFRPPLKIAALAGGVGLAVLTPWLLYQNVYDPPGNRLLKWHLAGSMGIDNRSFGQAIRDAYTSTPVAELINNRISNLNLLVDVRAAPFGPLAQLPATLRSFEFLYVPYGLGLVNLAWFCLALPAVRRRLRQYDVQLIKLALAVGLVSLLLWALMLFIPGTAIIHLGSYLTMMLLFAGLAAILAVLPRTVVGVLASVNIAVFLVVWVIDPLVRHAVNPWWLCSLVLGFAGTIAIGAVLVARESAGRHQASSGRSRNHGVPSPAADLSPATAE